MAHAKKSHPEVSELDFKNALDQKVRTDPSTVDLKRVTRLADMVSATQRVRDVRDQHYTAPFLAVPLVAVRKDRSARIPAAFAVFLTALAVRSLAEKLGNPKVGPRISIPF